jgi:hypothetical protein
VVDPLHLVAHLDELRGEGRLEEAAAVCRRILLLAPGHLKADRLLSSFTGEPAELEGVVGGLKPAPFVSLRAFLPGELRDALFARLVELEGRFEPAQMVSGRDDDYRRALILPGCFPHLGAALEEGFLAHLRAAFDRARRLLLVPAFEGRFDETHALAYTEGCFFGTHRDTGPKNTRRMTFVYQLQATPRPFEGGDLLLYDTYFRPGLADAPPGEPPHAATATRLVAEDNRLVLFPSEFYHEVTPVTGNGSALARARLAINGWIHGTLADGDLAALSATAY